MNRLHSLVAITGATVATFAAYGLRTHGAAHVTAELPSGRGAVAAAPAANAA